MKTEKIIISFIAIFVGVVFAGVAFYLYQSTKIVSSDQTKTVAITPPSPTPKATIYLSLDTPSEGEVFDKKVITVSGKTIPGSLVVITTDVDQQVVSPSSIGNFSATTTIDNDGNIINVTAIAPNGEEVTTRRIVTFSTENF
jgi:hypothetical protein